MISYEIMKTKMKIEQVTGGCDLFVGGQWNFRALDSFQWKKKKKSSKEPGIHEILIQKGQRSSKQCSLQESWHNYLQFFTSSKRENMMSIQPSSS